MRSFLNSALVNANSLLLLVNTSPFIFLDSRCLLLRSLSCRILRTLFTFPVAIHVYNLSYSFPIASCNNEITLEYEML